MIVLLYTSALLALGVLYLMKRYRVDWAHLRTVLANRRKICAMVIGSVCALIAVELVFLSCHDADQKLLLARWATLIVGLLVVSVTDCHEKLIPNKVLLILFCIRACFVFAEITLVPGYIKHVLLVPAFGGLIGAWVILAARLLSRRGAGMGDVKMFAVLGLYVGSTEILSTLFLCFLVSAVVGVALLATKKANAQDSLPMAPFALAGALIKLAFIAYGG